MGHRETGRVRSPRPGRRSSTTGRVGVTAVCLALALALAPGLTAYPAGSAGAAGAAGAGAVEQLGLGGATASVLPSCPAAPCVVVTATTGFQAAISGRHNSMVVGQPGRVTSWRIVLAGQTPAEIAYFDRVAHGPARAGLVVLRHVVDYRFRIIDAAPLVALAPSFGRTLTFLLDRPLPVRAGDVLALSVPTWAPVLAVGLDPTTGWRASRPRGACNDVFTPTAQTTFGALTPYECTYPGVGLTYGATVAHGPPGATAPPRARRGPTGHGA